MDITPLLSKNINFIKSYGLNGFKINNKIISYDFILSSKIIEPWETLDGIFAHASYQKLFNIIKSLNTSLASPIVIIGTGENYQYPPANFFNFFALVNIMPEVMTTPAAARTFNVLVSEEREVYALLKVW